MFGLGKRRAVATDISIVGCWIRKAIQEQNGRIKAEDKWRNECMARILAERDTEHMRQQLAVQRVEAQTQLEQLRAELIGKQLEVGDTTILGRLSDIEKALVSPWISIHPDQIGNLDAIRERIIKRAGWAE